MTAKKCSQEVQCTFVLLTEQIKPVCFFFISSFLSSPLGLLELADTSSGTQGQIVGARGSLNGRKNMKKKTIKKYIFI